ncbi:MAG TPA: hypothetical protein VKG80_13975 [Trebonia sp.]|nr:hypothetical protein [Trebonia sp.]
MKRGSRSPAGRFPFWQCLDGITAAAFGAGPGLPVCASGNPAGRDGAGREGTYLGIAPGVGKTYAMLRDARARRRAGADTVVAQWERHGRPGTGPPRPAPAGRGVARRNARSPSSPGNPRRTYGQVHLANQRRYREITSVTISARGWQDMRHEFVHGC